MAEGVDEPCDLYNLTEIWLFLKVIDMFYSQIQVAPSTGKFTLIYCQQQQKDVLSEKSV